jgi:hypothetical protein
MRGLDIGLAETRLDDFRLGRRRRLRRRCRPVEILDKQYPRRRA